MAYKKYIERNGKIYGPYVYHSRRVNGKVVSEYRGPKKNTKPRRVFLMASLFVILLSFAFWTMFFQSQFVGRVVLDLDQGISEGFEGNINLVLKQGELIPRDTKIILENGENSYEYFLSDLVNLDVVYGNYYLEDIDIVGEGNGFGLIGQVEEFVPVFFQLEIEDRVSSSGGGSVVVPEESVPEKIILEENVSEVSEDLIPEIASEEIVASEESISEVIPEDGESVPEVVPEEIVVSEESISVEVAPEESEVPVAEISTLTGNVIRSIGGVFSRPFTGNVINEETIIQGDVSKKKEFKQNIASDKMAKIVKNTVRTEEEELNSGVLDLEIINGKIIVTTDYSKFSEGFGKNYLGESVLNISILLSSFNIDFVEGPITLQGLYGELEIFSYVGKIQENVSAEDIITIPVEVEEIINGTILNISEENITIEINETLIEEITSEEFNLSEETVAVLMKEFGTTTVKSNVKKYRDKFLVELTIGPFLLNHYYPASLSNEELKIEIEKDKNVWLNDLAREFSREEVVFEEVTI